MTPTISDSWQLLETRNSNVTTQHVWSPAYVDAMVLRDRDTDGNGTFDQRFYVQHDANFNITSIADVTGAVVERYQGQRIKVSLIRVVRGGFLRENPCPLRPSCVCGGGCVCRDFASVN